MPAQVFADDFAGTNGDPPNPANWDVVIAGSGGTETAEIQSNALELTAQESGGTFGDVEVDCREAIGNVLEPRIDFTIIVPNTNRFFANFLLRQNVSRDNAYRLFVRRTSGDLEALLAKNHPVDGQNYAPILGMSEAVTLWNCRVQVTDGPNGPLLQGAVRDASLGAIPEGSWDLEIEDTGATPITAAGSAAASLTEVDGGAQTLVLDDWVVTDLAAGGVELAAALVADSDLSASLQVDRRLAASLPADSDFAASLQLSRELAASLPASGDIAADLRVERHLSAALPASADLSADLRITRQLSATLVATADIAAALQVGGVTELAAALVASSDLEATLQVHHRLAAALAADSDIEAAIVVTRHLAAELVADSDLVAAFPAPGGYVLIDRVTLLPAVGLTDIRISPGVSYAGDMEPAVQIDGATLAAAAQADGSLAPAVGIESANLELD